VRDLVDSVYFLTEVENSGYCDREYACVDVFALAWEIYISF
jgi:hypothetical protein